MDDMALLREYATSNSETAFEELISRRIGFVYSSALRQVRDPNLAEEITQAVFIILAQKAARISDKTILTGWLFKTTRFTALAQMRDDAKRRQREQEGQMQTELQPTATDLCWQQMSPLLDEALTHLGEKDRQAVLLRFFENKTLAEVGNTLGTGEDTARKRVVRALEKLHRYFSKRGISSTTAIIAGAISASSVQAAPAMLAKSVTAAAIVKGAAVSGSTLTLIKGALKIMAWTKAKTAVIAGVILALSTTTGVVGYKLVQAHEAKPPLHDTEFDIQADGIALTRSTLEAINTSKKTWGMNDGGPIYSGIDIERFTDEKGQAIKYTKQPGDNGNPFKYTFVLNQPVPPGGKCVLKMEGTLDGPGTGQIKPTGEPDVFEYHLNEQVGSQSVIHRINVYRLPPGAVLLEKSPSDLAAATNSGRVELRMDKMLPPPGKSDIRIRYRLAPATK